ncbi:MAG: hypothetical protein ACLQT6_05390 [Desulfomonilaceae bacterium]
MLFTDRIWSAYEIRYFGHGVMDGNSTSLVAEQVFYEKLIVSVVRRPLDSNMARRLKG